ncbi:Metaxin-3 [Irineochytrium annulatum]|nr:Metaxin-3 [Irineochytrium annulatum]
MPELYDALLFNRWLDAENFARSTRPMMAKTLPWVTRYHVPTQLRQKAQSRLKRYRIMLDVDGEAVNEVYLMARDIFKSLAAKLGDKPFFMGTHPTSLDAIAFGHLSMHAIPSLKNPRLFSILTFEFPTLIAYCDRVQKSLFATPPKLSPNIRPVSFLSDVVQRPSHYAREAWTVVARWGAKFTSEPSNGGGSGVETGADGASGATDKEKKKSSESEELVRAERREAFYRLLSAVSAVAAFGAYVAYQGIIRIETVDGDVGEEEEAA